MVRRRGASRGRSSTPASLWLFSGILIGLGLSWFLFSRGYLPYGDDRERAPSGPIAADGSGTALVDELESAGAKTDRPHYDFFTVLPEMEVIVPEEELNVRSRPDPQAGAVANGATRYLLQVGSFKQGKDAEQMKAKLALLGIVAQVQTVTVDDSTWHRVRVGPVTGARAAEDLRGQLAENGYDSLVMENPQ